MTSPLDMVVGQAGASAQSGRDLQNQLSNVGNLRGKNISPEAQAKKLREACEGFESIFIQKMWQEMRKAVPKGGMFQGREEQFWQDMYDQELSKHMTRAGGIGLADMMYAQLSRNLGAASKNSVAAYSAGQFAPTAAPILPQEQPAPAPAPEEPAQATPQPVGQAPQAATMPSIYDGEAPQTSENAVAEADAQPVQQANVDSRGLQPDTVAQAAASRPGAQPAEHPAAAQVENKRASRKSASRSQGENPIDLAQIARREAGDKLGSRAVRAPLHPHRTRKASSEQRPSQEELARQVAQAGQQPDIRPGTADDLKRAMEAARGPQTAPQASTSALADMAARVRAAAQGAPEAQTTAQTANPANPAAAQEAEPTVRKVTYTTNIPKNSRSKKGRNDAIRMLNVENANPNSNAGRGLAAYHAQQADGVAAQGGPARMSSPEPLTARNAPEASETGYAIPPLTTGDLKS